MDWKSFSFIGLIILGKKQILPIFELPGNISLSIDELIIIFAIGKVISSATR